jgi:ABC-type polysaccharide/polyol phosphate transport system ATPase subunit
MRARLGFSIALTMKAELLLIDEVLAVGDGRFQEKAESAMVEKMGSEQTAVLVSHSLQQVQKLCNRTLWLDGGKVKMLGKTDRVVAEYQQFLGA